MFALCAVRPAFSVLGSYLLRYLRLRMPPPHPRASPLISAFPSIFAFGASCGELRVGI
jgi:hypothetical protein